MKLQIGLQAVLTGALIVAAMLGATACAGDDEEKPPSIAVKTPGGEATPAGGQGETGQTVKMSLKDNFFQPKDFKVPAGKTITFELKNEGTAIHNMHILSKSSEGKDYSSEATILGGAESKFEVKFTKKGKVKYQCDYHVPDMVGTITVQ